MKRNHVLASLGSAALLMLSVGCASTDGAEKSEMAPASAEAGEGSCGGDKASGEGSCGGDKKESAHKDGEGSCGGDKKEEADKKDGEGSCGEGSCG